MGSSTTTAATIKINFEPFHELKKEEDCDILCLHLHGFKKEELKVQVISRDVLKISGTTSVGDNRFMIFEKDFPFSQNYDTKNITATFGKGILQVRLPKLKMDPKNQDDQAILQARLPKLNAEDISESDRTKKDRINQLDDEHKDRKNMPGHIDADRSTNYELDPATKLKMARKKMMMVVAVLYVIALGILISKMQTWFSRKYDN